MKTTTDLTFFSLAGMLFLVTADPAFAVKPTIGHLKSDNRLSCNHLTSKTGNQINTHLAAVGYNLRKLR